MASFVKKLVNGNANARFLLDLLPKQYYYYMKYLVVSLILFFCTLQTFGQQEYFIYLQTENNQPFYTRINNNVFSSTGSGYLILSKIPDSLTSVIIGFPKNVFPEQQFNIPVSHKDGGYLIKNFGDKGWGLFNLQSASVIISLTPPEEKKKPEITGTRKSDAFALLLANAVNDSAVLYTSVRPPKRSPEIIAEKKKDTVLHVAASLPKDSIALVNKHTGKPDSTVTAKNHVQKNNDTAKTSSKIPARGTQNNIVKNKAKGKDTTALTKNATVTPVHATVKPAVKKDSALLARNATTNKKEPAVKGRKFSLFRGREKTAVAKNDRKDTIILMSGGRPAAKPVAKAAIPEKDSSALSMKKTLPPIEQKRDTSVDNRNDVAIEKVATKPDTPAANKKDTTALIAITEPAEQKTDTSFNPPVKRLRPYINKVAELLTDTSYIAVFVDESKEKFDTIRISIPFNELLAFSSMQKKSATLPDPGDKKINDSIALKGVEQRPEIGSKKDSVRASSPLPRGTMDSNAIAKKEIITGDSVAASPVIVKTEINQAEKTHADSLKILQQQLAASTTSRKDSAVPKPTSDSTINTHSPVVVAKKDSVSIANNTTASKPAIQKPLVNSDCKEIATVTDIDKLRIKMLVVNTDEDRIALARKLVKQKCLLTNQVRALSELFKTDEGKYKWLDATYVFVSDAENFAALGEIIKDEYYLNRFKAMLRH